LNSGPPGWRGPLRGAPAPLPLVGSSYRIRPGATEKADKQRRSEGITACRLSWRTQDGDPRRSRGGDRTLGHTQSDARTHRRRHAHAGPAACTRTDARTQTHARTYTRTDARTQTHARTYNAQTQTHARTYIHTYRRTDSDARTYIPTYRRTQGLRQTHAGTCAHTHTDGPRHAHIHGRRCTHAYIHTHMYRHAQQGRRSAHTRLYALPRVPRLKSNHWLALK
jgi:hypothetical protein